jgi:hypothetical protein
MDEKAKIVFVHDIPNIPHECKDQLYLAIKQAIVELRDLLIAQNKLISDEDNEDSYRIRSLAWETRNKLRQGFDLLWRYNGMIVGVHQEMAKHKFTPGKIVSFAPKFVRINDQKNFTLLVSASNYWLLARNITKNFDQLFSKELSCHVKIHGYTPLATVKEDLITVQIVKNVTNHQKC